MWIPVVAAAVAVVVAVTAIVLFNNRGNAGGPSPGGSTSSPATVPDPSTSQPPSSPATTRPATARPTTTSRASSATRTSKAPSPSQPSSTGSREPSVVPTRSVPSTRAPLRQKGDLGNGVTVQVSDIQQVDGEAQGPGEVAGPALRVSVEVQNGTDNEISMELALANLYYGPDRTPASSLSGPGVRSFPAAIAAGKSASARYVFGVPKQRRNPLAVEFSYTVDAPTVIFEGNL